MIEQGYSPKIKLALRLFFHCSLFLFGSVFIWNYFSPTLLEMKLEKSKMDLALHEKENLSKVKENLNQKSLEYSRRINNLEQHKLKFSESSSSYFRKSLENFNLKLKSFNQVDEKTNSALIKIEGTVPDLQNWIYSFRAQGIQLKIDQLRFAKKGKIIEIAKFKVEWYE